jgi:hypothetical protein
VAIVETVAVRGASTVAALDSVKRTPLDKIPVDQAEEIARHITGRQDSGVGAVEVARFGSSV